MKSSLFFLLLFCSLNLFSNIEEDTAIYDLIQVNIKPLLKNSKDIKGIVLNDFIRSGV